jgi:two-component system OmpR family response regulator
MNIKNTTILFYLPEDSNIDLLDYLISKDIYIISVTDEEVLEAIDKEAYNLAILYDYKNTPGDMTLITRVRQRSECCPIIIVSNSDNINTKINAFYSGISDYIVRPCNYEEFYLRILSIIRLSNFSGTFQAKAAINNIRYYSIGKYILDVPSKKLIYRDIAFDLTAAERSILLCLLNNKNKSVSILELVKAARNMSPNATAAKNTIRAVICTLRAKLKFDSNVNIESTYREGYILTIANDTQNANSLAADLL